MNPDYQILLYYKYVEIADPEELRVAQRELCERLGLKGRVIVAQEGINGTVEGTTESTESYIKEMQQDQRFADINFKRSAGTGTAFPKLSIRVRAEIVSSHLGEKDIDPNEVTGQRLSAEELHHLYESDQEFYVVDMRNDYEHQVGHFENSILPPLSNFRDLSEILDQLAEFKDKKVVTVCTGGVRCEKASGFLVANGFKDVYQLQDGIVTYMQQFPNKHFKGKLYVFDGRVTMGFETDSPEYETIGKCAICGEKSENYVNCADPTCHKHFICCENCLAENGNAYCDDECLLNHTTLLQLA